MTPDISDHRVGWHRGRSALVSAALLLVAGVSVTMAQIHDAQSTHAVGTTLNQGRTLSANESLMSPNGDYQLVMQPDGDLVENSLFGISPIYSGFGTVYEYFGGGNANGGILVGRNVQKLWDSGTQGNPGAMATMQADGNLVVTAAGGKVLWASGTAGHPGASIVVQDDANTVVYISGKALWANNRVSTTNSGDNGATAARSCPTVGGNTDVCGIKAYLPNGTGVTMLCWTSTTPPTWAKLTTNKWFYVQVHSSDENDYVFVNAAYVQNQIPTPECIAPPANGEIPTAPTVTSGSPPQNTTPDRPTGNPPAANPTTGSTLTRHEPAPSKPSSPGRSAPATSAPVHATPPPPTTSASPPVPQTWQEQSGSHGSPTFTDPYNASGVGSRIPAMSTVAVLCRVYAPQIGSANPDGWWYRIATSPWNGQYYAVANTFWNGDTPGNTPYTHNTDWNVKVC